MVYPKRSTAKQSPTRIIKDAPATAKRSPSRTRSPSRQKSPSRVKTETGEKSPSRRKSSGVATKSSQRSGKLTPTRRSPIRKVGAMLNFSDDDLRSTPQITKRSKVIEIETKVDSDEDTVQIKQKPRSSSRTRTKNNVTTKLQDNERREISVESNSSTISRRVTRLSQSRERILQLKPLDSFTTKMSEFSDEEEKPPSKLDVSHTKSNYVSTAVRLKTYNTWS
ncbi:hypothetical protein GWI33_022307 [Rhynchophorus ferrugineus]|uniref:Uncharacterized protein n=1 Tax=Rhynchophorus ferrugineus TaxID=354439 RepID=A0A834MMN0_RHYFE|nr:hypothetical protein GWI33_022307 [Rhynchophorus ferrugineus]